MATSLIERLEARVKTTRAACERIKGQGTLPEQRVARKKVKRARRKLMKLKQRQELYAKKTTKKTTEES